MGGVAELARAAEAAAAVLRAGLTTASRAGASHGSTAAWAASLASLQQVVDIATAAQDLSITRLAAVEVEEAEDGTLRESHRAPGHVSLDAAPVVAGALSTTAVHAEHRVRTAVRLAADGPEGSASATGLRRLHEAMREGRLDPYRAGVLATELEEVPADVASAVLATMEPHLADETGPELRRRCRRLLARVSPDLLRQRARRARSESRLERWASEPGVDTWHGTFPSEEAARAWAAVDALAQRYVADGTCERIDRARARALTDLVTGHATVTAEIVLTVPAALDAASDAPGHEVTGAAPPSRPERHPDDLVEVPGLRPGEPALVPRGWLSGLARDTASAARGTPPSRGGRRGSRRVCCHPVTGALLDPQEPAPDAPHTPKDPAPDAPHTPKDPAPDAPLTPQDPAPGETSAPRRSARDDDRAGRTDPGPYRPSPRLAALVRARDGRCRFPGCHIAARFCDLDHVRPWPAGPTTAANLVCLCRRHHRTKQRPGWTARLAGDGILTWTDPTGRTRTTAPLDALHPAVLPRRRWEPPVTRRAPGLPRLDLPDGPHSHLEHTLEHLLARRRAAPPACLRPAHHATRHGTPHAVSNPNGDDPPF